MSVLGRAAVQRVSKMAYFFLSNARTLISERCGPCFRNLKTSIFKVQCITAILATGTVAPESYFFGTIQEISTSTY
jgi:hypothetical protein